MNNRTCLIKKYLFGSTGTQLCGGWSKEQVFRVRGCSVTLPATSEETVPLKVSVWTNLDGDAADESYGIDNVVIQQIEEGIIGELKIKNYGIKLHAYTCKRARTQAYHSCITRHTFACICGHSHAYTGAYACTHLYRDKQIQTIATGVASRVPAVTTTTIATTKDENVVEYSAFENVNDFEGWNCGKITTCGKLQLCGGYNVKGTGSDITKTVIVDAGTYYLELDFIKIDSWCVCVTCELGICCFAWTYDTQHGGLVVGIVIVHSIVTLSKTCCGCRVVLRFV